MLQALPVENPTILGKKDSPPAGLGLGEANRIKLFNKKEKRKHVLQKKNWRSFL